MYKWIAKFFLKKIGIAKFTPALVTFIIGFILATGAGGYFWYTSQLKAAENRGRDQVVELQEREAIREYKRQLEANQSELREVNRRLRDTQARNSALEQVIRNTNFTTLLAEEPELLLERANTDVTNILEGLRNR
jgi:hypothetical protein